jgi:hypothetical protein
MEPSGDRDAWADPLPETVPAPTYWPAVLALGVMGLFFGVLTSPIVLAMGLCVFAVAVCNWIGELLDEWEYHGDRSGRE